RHNRFLRLPLQHTPNNVNHSSLMAASSRVGACEPASDGEERVCGGGNDFWSGFGRFAEFADSGEIAPIVHTNSDSMPRLWICLTAIWPLAALGCKTANVASPSPAPSQVPAMAWTAPTPAAAPGLPPGNAAVAPGPFQQAGPTIQPVEFQEPLPQPMPGEVMSREWLAAE